MLGRIRLSLANIKAFAKELPIPLSLILPAVPLYIIDPNSFQSTWKGRLPYLFFLWLFFLELTLARRKLPKNTLRTLKQTRTLAAAIAMAVPTVYVIATYMFGLKREIIEVGLFLGLPAFGYYESLGYWPLSVEYIVFTTFFTTSVLLMYGIKGLKGFAVSLFFLGATGSFYMIDTFYPYGTLIALQRLVPFTASSAARVLNWMGYETRLFHYGFTRYMDTMAVKEVVTLLWVGGEKPKLLFVINWPCAGVHSLLIYTFVILLFLKDANFTLQRKAIQAAIPKRLKLVVRGKRISFLSGRKKIRVAVMAAERLIVEVLRMVPMFIVIVIGAVGTFIVNVLRIASIYIIGVNAGSEAAQMFHNYYGELYFIVWIILYLLAIIYVPRIFIAKAKAERPLGVAILAILDILGANLAIFAGIGFMVVPTVIAKMGEAVALGGLFAFFEAFTIALGLIFLILGILGIAVGWGFWRGSRWAWALGFVFYVIGIVLGVISLALYDYISILIVIIGALLVYYLFRPNVKTWFGKA